MEGLEQAQDLQHATTGDATGHYLPRELYDDALMVLGEPGTMFNLTQS